MEPDQVTYYDVRVRGRGGRGGEGGEKVEEGREGERGGGRERERGLGSGVGHERP